MMVRPLVLLLKTSLIHNDSEIYSFSCKYAMGYMRQYILPVLHLGLLIPQGRRGGGEALLLTCQLLQRCKSKHLRESEANIQV